MLKQDTTIVPVGRLIFYAAILALCACHRPTTESATRAPVATVRVTPTSVTLPVGQSLKLTALLGDAAGNRLAARSAVSGLLRSGAPQSAGTIGDAKGTTGRIVTWRSAEPTRVSVDAGGLLSAVAPGKATVTATSEGRSGTTQIIATEPSLAPVSVMPTAASMAVGETLQFHAKPRNAQPDAASAIAWSSDQPSRARVDSTGRVTAMAPGSAKITATWNGQRGVSALTITSAEKTIHGLDFPGSAGVNATMRFEFRSPLAAYPATYIWRAYPRQQQSYYTAFFWGNSGAFYPSNTYYGFHPYPDWNTAYQHFWEIAAPPGGDFVSAEHVVYDRWYVQVGVCSVSGNTTVHEFYWDWPDLRKVVRHIGVRQSDPPAPGLVVGDAPWNSGREVWDGVLRGFQFYDAALPPKQVAQEIASPGSVRTPWYLNMNPKPSDISDESGNGHNPEWVGKERPSAWTGVEDSTSVIHTRVSPR